MAISDSAMTSGSPVSFRPQRSLRAQATCASKAPKFSIARVAVFPFSTPAAIYIWAPPTEISITEHGLDEVPICSAAAWRTDFLLNARRLLVAPERMLAMLTSFVPPLLDLLQKSEGMTPKMLTY